MPGRRHSSNESRPASNASLTDMPRARRHQGVAGRARRADRDARPRGGLRDRQPHRARTLELSVEEPATLLPKIRHAGAIFLGRYTSEALGDYCAGPNHVLPTSRTARFSSPLGVYDFQKRTSMIQVSPEGARTLGLIAAELAAWRGIARAREIRRSIGFIDEPSSGVPWSTALRPYVPGEQPKLPNLVKLNTNENPYGPSPKVLEALRAELGDSLRLYPDP